MKENRINAVIALATVAAAILMLAALSFAIGKWSFGQNTRRIVIKFPNATGLNANCEVKYAGAPVGRVKEIVIIPLDKQDIDPETNTYNCIDVIAEVDSKVEIGNDVKAAIKQDGLGITPRYVLLTPGPDHNSPDLADDAVLQGVVQSDISDLMQPAEEALGEAKALLVQLKPILGRIDLLSESLQSQLPPLITSADGVMTHGNQVLSDFDSPKSKAQIQNMLSSLQVSSENLKVVSSNAKALTATLAEKPWRVFWGGSTIKAPSESKVLQSNQVIPLKNDTAVPISSQQ